MPTKWSEGLRLTFGVIEDTHLAQHSRWAGVGAEARFFQVEGLAADRAGNVFVADSGNHTIRKIVVASAQVTTLAGSPLTAGSSDGTGPHARFDRPTGIVCDDQGNLFVADAGNHTIRKVVLATQAVTTVVGTANRMGVVLGPLPAGLSRPMALTIGPSGELLIADGDLQSSDMRTHLPATAGLATLAIAAATGCSQRSPLMTGNDGAVGGGADGAREVSASGGVIGSGGGGAGGGGAGGTTDCLRQSPLGAGYGGGACEGVRCIDVPPPALGYATCSWLVVSGRASVFEAVRKCFSDTPDFCKLPSVSMPRARAR